MALSKQALKGRIRSINATKKITSAMELIANSKLQRQRNMMEKNREYASYLKSMMQSVLAGCDDADNRFMKINPSKKTLTIMFTSDLGLCGGYNSNMQRYAHQNLNHDDPLILIGSKGRSWLLNRGFTILNEPMESDNLSFNELGKIADQALNMVLNQEVSKIQVLYTRFVNTVSFQPELSVLFPLEKNKEEAKELSAATIFEPSPNEILENLIPMVMRSLVYSIWLETKTAEQGSRRLAMENATDNAEELTDKLVLQFNQARQAAITQEITEIVAGADAL